MASCGAHSKVNAVRLTGLIEAERLTLVSISLPRAAALPLVRCPARHSSSAKGSPMFTSTRP